MILRRNCSLLLFVGCSEHFWKQHFCKTATNILKRHKVFFFSFFRKYTLLLIIFLLFTNIFIVITLMNFTILTNLMVIGTFSEHVKKKTGKNLNEFFLKRLLLVVVVNLFENFSSDSLQILHTLLFGV